MTTQKMIKSQTMMVKTMRLTKMTKKSLMTMHTGTMSMNMMILASMKKKTLTGMKKKMTMEMRMKMRAWKWCPLSETITMNAESEVLKTI